MKKFYFLVVIFCATITLSSCTRIVSSFISNKFQKEHTVEELDRLIHEQITGPDHFAYFDLGKYMSEKNDAHISTPEAFVFDKNGKMLDIPLDTACPVKAAGSIQVLSHLDTIRRIEPPKTIRDEVNGLKYFGTPFDPSKDTEDYDYVMYMTGNMNIHKLIKEKVDGLITSARTNPHYKFKLIYIEQAFIKH